MLDLCLVVDFYMRQDLMTGIMGSGYRHGLFTVGIAYGLRGSH